MELGLGDAEDASSEPVAGPRPGARGGVQQGVDLVPIDAVVGDVLASPRSSLGAYCDLAVRPLGVKVLTGTRDYVRFVAAAVRTPRVK
jgi:hypothetical protein